MIIELASLETDEAIELSALVRDEDALIADEVTDNADETDEEADESADD